ncbi:low specificity L-threonine aldolase [Limibaculum sp. M0105]|uniref:L-threonine aldolase n=1 Tax=Thermohalobaculum xanthum TaxID=2753746 RepID=A0A8J7SDA0_9RHOB|nr:beta-eliminating lyase-related protein [Thermohalobaculum xanthum]MBK0399932.1 low specificity L-threonine aldolase [Thermohalobaculum xanthum]
MFFASDNASGVAPELLDALGTAAAGHAMPYGNDDLTRAVEDRIRELFEAPDARVYLVGTGTAANALALGCLSPPWGRIYCHDAAHIEQDECSAPEFYTGGAKLSLIGGLDAKIGAAGLSAALVEAQPGVVHSAQPAALSISQATELGAAYTPDEIAALSRLAREAGLPVHMDGTRFSNAVARLGASPAEMSWRAGVDVLCLGATKCGAMAAEAVILFDPSRAWEFELRRKRGGHLFSKMRFVAAQMLAWLDDGLWLRLAGHANAMADRLAAGIAASGAAVLNPVDANMIFARITLGQHRRLQAAGARYYLWPKAQLPEGGDEAPVEIRLVTSFATTPNDVDRFLEVLAG